MVAMITTTISSTSIEICRLMKHLLENYKIATVGMTLLCLSQYGKI